MGDRPIQVWKNYNKWLDMEGWVNINFNYLEPGDIVRFDFNDSYIYRIISYPFKSTKYSYDKNIPVETIIAISFLYYPENY